MYFINIERYDMSNVKTLTVKSEWIIGLTATIYFTSKANSFRTDSSSKN
ncbi:MAG: hypothetical protein ACI9J5_003774 [Paraglaciecola sp.]|jgi:hypothetical protein